MTHRTRRTHRTRSPRTGAAEETARRRSPSRPALTRLAVVGACAGAAVTSSLIGPAASARDGAAELHARDKAPLTALKKSLAPYRDVGVALADGYVPAGECAEIPGQGAMGIHYLNPARMASIDPARPALLLYAPTPGGGRELLGAEWFQADADQDLGTDGDRPSLWGRPFDGPMPGHEPGMPVHYDLHVWLFDNNPAGVFAPWNTSVTC